jgi:thioredoxin reductase
MTGHKIYDVIIIGGSYAGLSAAMSLGRSLREVLIIDGGLPCNRQTPHSHNFITHDGEKPAIIAKKAKQQVLKYDTISFHNDFAIKGKKTPIGFEITTQSGNMYNAKKLIFATGVKDIMPDIKGFAECWGTTVIHCPYCHGYEFRNKKTGIMANGERAFHLASLVNNLTEEITIFTSGEKEFSTDQNEKLSKHGIEVIKNNIMEIVHVNGHLKSVILDNGDKLKFDAVYASIPFIQHSEIPVELGCELTEHGHIKVDMFQKTTIEGVFACGDNSAMMRSVSYAVSTGNIAGAMVNKELIDERF